MDEREHDEEREQEWEPGTAGSKEAATPASATGRGGTPPTAGGPEPEYDDELPPEQSGRSPVPREDGPDKPPAD